jgi:pyrroline-5-carboxylate reductase
MGLALLKGVSRVVQVYGYDTIPEKKSEVEKFVVTWARDEVEIAQKCKYILLAIKPQGVGGVLDKIASTLTEDSVIISICAGISLEYIRSKTSENQKVICVMPNTPMMLGYGASAISTDEKTTREELSFARSILDSCGISEIIPSDKMNEVICINGSSPAFIYLFAKCFTDYAAEQGIDSKSAMSLFSQALIGSAKMLTETGKTPHELIEQVSSPNGTTVAGLALLRANGFEESVKSACEACTSRAYELGKNN